MRKLARAKQRGGNAVNVTRTLLKSWAIEQPESDDSKDERGRVLVIGGDREIPGAVLLAGIAALRAGAGKLQIATCESVAVQIGIAVPEARVIGLPETEDGSIRGSVFNQVKESVSQSHSVLLGPGMTNKAECNSLLEALIQHAGKCTLVLDAGALSPLAGRNTLLSPSGISAVITPHAGEMASILKADIEVVHEAPAACAARVAQSLGVIVVLKGPETHIVSPEGAHYVYRGGDVGLATSGSGDTLAGIVAGLAARIEDPLQAAVWGVFVHGEAGNVLAKKSGRVGYLARELLHEIPSILNRLSASA